MCGLRFKKKSKLKLEYASSEFVYADKRSGGEQMKLNLDLASAIRPEFRDAMFYSRTHAYAIIIIIIIIRNYAIRK